MKRRKVLITHFLIKQDNCDSACKYCYHHPDSKSETDYSYDGELKKNLKKIIAYATQNYESPIVKISGGEIFLMSNLKEFVKELFQYYPYVLIQTNGRHLHENGNLEWIINSKRILLQISLDGHEMDMNKYRFENPKILENLVNSIKILKENSVYLEITSVLNNKNTDRYDEFLQYLDDLPVGRYTNTLKSTPILIVDKEQIYTPKEEQIETVDRVVEHYDNYKNVLPPKKYMLNLQKLMHKESLSYQCFNPVVSLNITDDGKIKGCTNILPENVLNVGNILEDSTDVLNERFGKTKFQNLLVSTKQRVPICKNCFNFCSIYNLYLNDSITIEELCENNYMFGLEEVKQTLIELKKSIEEAKEKGRWKHE